MGACSSTVGTSYALTEARIETMRGDILRQLNDSTSTIDQRVVNSQVITIDVAPVEVLGLGSLDPKYLEKTPGSNIGPFGIRGKSEGCPKYGCVYNIDQNFNVNIQNFNQNTINQSDLITTTLINRLKQDARSDISSPTAASEADTAIEASREIIKEDIEEILRNLVNEDYYNTDEINISYDPRMIPIIYSDPNPKPPCPLGPPEKTCPTINTDFILDKITREIINKVMGTVRTSLDDRNIDVVQEIKSDNSGCILQLIIISVVLCICMIICWIGIGLILSDDNGDM
tara:strand:- start:425 stop:1285 length:861 start_codon:yes stop_codon:yes gene_type:complete